MNYHPCCYLFHFDRPVGLAQHYLGWTRDIETRLAQHYEGCGSLLTSVAVRHGVTLWLVRTWPGGTPLLEQKLKRRCPAYWCPICGDAYRLGLKQRRAVVNERSRGKAAAPADYR